MELSKTLEVSATGLLEAGLPVFGIGKHERITHKPGIVITEHLTGFKTTRLEEEKS